jgi:hypothetical protein
LVFAFLRPFVSRYATVWQGPGQGGRTELGRGVMYRSGERGTVLGGWVRFTRCAGAADLSMWGVVSVFGKQKNGQQVAKTTRAAPGYGRRRSPRLEGSAQAFYAKKISVPVLVYQPCSFFFPVGVYFFKYVTK